ncbi:hypothetical protein GJAV_G00196940 [Gymnothorax javanicus]|nr:hypothetical protein GJAV_G00196940 [Gymnothorax javanicus]
MASESPTENGLFPDSTPQKTETHPLSSSQFLEELMRIHARRNAREPSLESSSPPTSPPSTPVSPPSTPRTPPVTPPLLLSPTSETGLALSSPELLSELKHPRPLRHIKPQRGLTTVFSGRGRVSQGPAQVHSSGKSPNPPSPDAGTDERQKSAGRRFLANGTQR